MSELPSTELPPIQLLPAEVANQIAAGEVVERPASVVKELVENSLDAGARVVTVSIDGGGVARIAITDDGHGMSREDLSLSVVRHATSKIRSADDLLGVGTYGFRGEALASIGSVSRLCLTSRKRTAEEGCEVKLEGNATPAVRAIGCAVGTTVSVEDLFFNTPARRKFLRTPQTEWGACADTVARLALPRPDVRFVLRKDGKVVREYLRRDTVAERVREMWPDETLTEIDGRRGTVHIRAFLGPPERARTGTTGIAVYVNGRFVRDKLLLRAIAQAYGSTLDGGRYPPGAMLVDVPAAQVDVNVHPQKAEVRFAQQNEVFASVVSLLRDGLSTAPWAKVLTGAPSGADDGWSSRFDGAPRGGAPSTSASDFDLSARPYSVDVSKLVPPEPATRSLFARREHTDSRHEEISSTESSTPRAAPLPVESAEDPWRLAPTPTTPTTPTAPSIETEYAAVMAAAIASPRVVGLAGDTGLPDRQTFSALRFVAQVRRMFLICEGEWGLVMLDQHAAAERVVFDRLRKSYASRDVRVQPLLVHETFDVTAREMTLAEEHAEDLAKIGFELTPLGTNTLAVRAVPALLVRADPRRLARDILAELARQGSEFSRALDLVLATMACHGSVRGGDELAAEEARALLTSLDDCDFGGHCPHGRPVLFSIKWSELERKVGR
ncbi:MAG: DNA mismatch repair endonuclease MutL [Myxococcales bacterium]|nr:DNA mismatch repair endonuclease MutL [Myxococcales bacterium]